MLSGEYDVFLCYSECASTQGKLKSLPDHGGNRTREVSFDIETAAGEIYNYLKKALLRQVGIENFDVLLIFRRSVFARNVEVPNCSFVQRKSKCTLVQD